jgi:hypothetical protein
MTDTVPIPREIVILMLSLIGFCACCFESPLAQRRIIQALDEALKG